MPDVLSILFVVSASATAAFVGVGLWNVFIHRLITDAQEVQGEGIVRALQRVILRRMSHFNERTFSKPYLQRIDTNLMYAGYPSELRSGEFIGLQQVSLAASALFAVLLVFGLTLKVVWTLPILLLGWFYPWIWLKDQVKKRQHQIVRALPYNLDLLTLSVEAGLDFAQALGKVVEKGRQGPLAEEFRLVLKNIKLGKTREEALRALADRTGVVSINSFANALIQADRMGTSLGKILRIQSTQLRIERTNRAEKLANEAPVKMLFPLIACIFPTVFMILFGPIIFQVITGSD